MLNDLLHVAMYVQLQTGDRSQQQPQKPTFRRVQDYRSSWRTRSARKAGLDLCGSM